MEVGEFGDYGGERVAELLIVDPFDLPADPAKPTISAFVALCIESTAVPRDVIHLDGPADAWVGAVRMDDDAARELEWMLSDEFWNPSATESVQHSELEFGSGGPLPRRTL